jgi:hypothetical protein
MLDPCLWVWQTHAWFEKQQKRGQLCILVVRREKRKKNTNNRSPAAIQLLFVYTRHTMGKRARLHIQLDGGWPDLAIEKRHTRLFNGTGVAHSLGREEHVPIVFWLKNNKYRENTKTPSWSSYYTKHTCKIIKIPPNAKLLFIFSKTKSVIWLYLKIRKTWTLLWKKAKEMCYPLVKR